MEREERGHQELESHISVPQFSPLREKGVKGDTSHDAVKIRKNNVVLHKSATGSYCL